MAQPSLTLWLKEFKQLFNQLNATNLELLEQWYSQEIVFQDPLHQIQGLSQLKRYFSGLYENLLTIHFDYQWEQLTDSEIVLGWEMSYRHTKLNRGREIKVEGATRLLICDGKISSHRDYFDAGAMLYEQVPVMGGAIRWLKQKAAGES